MAEQVKVTITAQDQTKAGINSVESNLQGLGQAADNIQGKAVAAFAALSVAIGGAVKISMDFEASMDRVAAISQTTGSEFEALKTKALEMGAETVYSATQAADALTYLAMAGFNTEQQISAIPGILSMAAVEMMDLGQAADIGSGILAGFNLQAADMGRVADILTAGSVSTNVSITDLGEAMKFLGPVASSLGMSLEQTVAAVGLLGNAGIKGGEAGRQLRSGLTDLINPSAEAADVLKALGVTAADQNGQFRGLADILGQLQKATEGMSETQRAATVATIVGQQSMSTFLALMQTGPDAIRGLTTELENSGGAADRIANQQLDNLKGSLEEMKSQFEDAAIAVGDAFNRSATAAVAVITDLLAMIAGVARDSPGAVREIGMLALAVAASTIAVAAATRAWIALRAVSGPQGWAILAAGAVVGVMADVAISSKAAAIQHDKQGESLIGLAGHYDDLTRAMNDAGATDAERAKVTNDQKKAIEEIGAAFPELVKRWDEHGKAVELDTQRLKENTQAALDNVRANGQKELIDLQGNVTNTYGAVQTVDAELERAKESVRRSLAGELRGGTITQEQYDQALAANFAKLEAALAGRMQDARQAYNRAVAKVGQKQSELNGPNLSDFIDQEIKIYDPAPKAKDGSGTTGAVPGSKGAGGANTMSDALKADLESLQDLQALERTPDNMARILAKTRGIIATHYDELAKLDKLRDMQRQAQISLPNEIAQAEYNAALSLLDADKTLKNLRPEAFAQGLRGIRDKFSAYLEAHPDQALQMDLRLNGASAEELKAPLDRWREAMRTAESAGALDGTGGLDRKLLLLRNGLSLALGAGDQSAVADLTGQIRGLEKTLSNANFADKFDRIKRAREDAFTGAAGALTQLEMDLMDEEAKGDKASPQRIAALKQQVLDAVRPALEAERASLEALRAAVLADTTISEEERFKRAGEIEASLNGVRSDLYAQDVNAHRIATEAKTAAEKASAKEREDAEKKLTEARKESQKDALAEIDKAEKAATDAFKKGAQAREDAIQRQIDGKDEQLKQLDRQIAQEDRLQKIHDAENRIADLQHSGERRQVMLADGSTVERIVGMEEAQKALEDAKRDDKRARERQSLQDQLEALRLELQAEKDSNRDKEEAIKDHFTAAKEALTEGFAAMDEAQGEALATMQSNLADQLDALLGEYRSYAKEAARIIRSIPTAPPPDAPAVGSPSSGAAPDEYRIPGTNHRAFYTGADLPGGDPHLAVVNDVPEVWLPKTGIPAVARSLAADISALFPRMLSLPTIPAGIAGGAQTFAATMQVNVTVPPGTPQQMQQAAYKGAYAGGQAVLDAARRGMNERRIGGTKT